MSRARTISMLAGLTLVLAPGHGAGQQAPRTFSVDVGNMKVKVDPSKKLKIALFIEIATNSAVQSTIEGAKKRAAAVGATVDVFDANLDITRQINQMQNALNRDYNAWIVVPVEGTQVCDIVTREAPQRGILIASATGAVCGRSGNEGQALWSPGTLIYVGGNETPNAFKAVMLQAIKDNPGPLKVGVITGPELHPITRSIDKALAEVMQTHPDFQVVSKLRTDYSPPDSQSKAAAMLQANPGLNVIIGAYTNMSKGAVPALQAAGRSGKVKLYEAGGTVWSVEALKHGDIMATTGFYRRTAAERAVQALVDARSGKKVPRVTLNDGKALLPGQRPGQTAIITKANVSNYRPESP